MGTPASKRLLAGAAMSLLVVAYGTACNLVLGDLHDRAADASAHVEAGSDSSSPGDSTSREADSSRAKDSGVTPDTATEAATADAETGCNINGTAYPSGAPCPTNACRSCQPGTSTTTWTPTSTTTCGGSGTCSSGSCVVVPSTPPASCAGDGGAGQTNCGASKDESCCTTLEVQGGTYQRMYPDLGNGMNTGAPATVSSFALDKYDVTVGRFRRFRNAVLPSDGGTGWLPDAGAGKHAHLNSGAGLSNVASAGGPEPGWNPEDDGYVQPLDTYLTGCAPSTWTSSPANAENLPISCVDWAEAYAFCIWDGGFLPSEAEWEYAAAGGSLEFSYPWGSADPSTQPNAYAIYGCSYKGSAGVCSGVVNVAPVGTATAGAGFWGQLDMAGEMNQWALDWYDVNTSTAPYVVPCSDGAYLTPSPTSKRVIRGGDFNSSMDFCIPPYRNYNDPLNRNASVGFRCARTP